MDSTEPQAPDAGRGAIRQADKPAAPAVEGPLLLEWHDGKPYSQEDVPSALTDAEAEQAHRESERRSRKRGPLSNADVPWCRFCHLHVTAHSEEEWAEHLEWLEVIAEQKKFDEDLRVLERHGLKPKAPPMDRHPLERGGGTAMSMPEELGRKIIRFGPQEHGAYFGPS